MAAIFTPFDVVSGNHHVVQRHTFWDFEVTVPTERKAGGLRRSLSDGVLAELSSCLSDIGTTVGGCDTASMADDSTVEADSCCEISDSESEVEQQSESDVDSSCSRAGSRLWSEASDVDSAKDLSLTHTPVTFIAPAVCVIPMMQTMVCPIPYREGQPDERQAQQKPGKKQQAGMASSTAVACFGAGSVQDCRTTLIFKNMSVRVMRRELVEMLDKHGFAGLFDFVYIRTNFKAMTSFGYGFANFVDHSTAERARLHFHGAASSLGHPAAPEGDVLEVSWTSEHQGLEPHLAHFRNSPLMHSDVPDEFKPLVLRNGVPVPMPPPTRRLSAPKELRRALSGAEQNTPEHA